MAKGDSAASSHYWRDQDKTVLNNIKNCIGPSVLLPNNELISSTSRGQLPLSSDLSNAAKTAMILPKLTSSSLISLGQLCDDDCAILLNKNTLLAIKNNKIILKGTRNPHDKLWDIPIQKQSITPNNYATSPIHPAIYSKVNAVSENHVCDTIFRYQNNYASPPIHPAIYSKANMVTENNVCDTNFRYHQRLDRKSKEKQSLLYELNQFSDIIEHNILDNALSKVSPAIRTSEAVDTNSTATKAKLNKLPSHPNDFPRQPTSRLTDITYVNKGYNARRPSTPENSQPQVVDFIKAHIEPSNPSLSVIIRKKQTHTDLARYLHAACLSPVSWTFATAIKKGFFQNMARTHSRAYNKTSSTGNSNNPRSSTSRAPKFVKH